ncbi:alpha/beta hydrolase [Corynebacterium sp. c8Ua_181]|uniref:Alpha/beta hydrolase n=1 Tax=Corynebacterium curieae TaxID=2913500 RepID=A0A9X3MAB9_9CORY|nr:alpha/beta hydrolase [Corynebacterium curieae]MCZ9307181.1 alpha/beta hydrolase [Corynebacterium curieae]MDV2423338.1 alpha/beta hydrolase [Corynebacterium curieae]
MRISRSFKVAAALAGGAGAVGAAAYALSRRPYLRQVAPGLRSPILYLPMHLLPDATFARASRFFATIDFSRPIRHAVDIAEFSTSFEGRTFSARVLTPSGGVAPTASAAESESRLRPMVVWTHGGGHLIGGPAMYDPQNARLAAELGAIVVAPRYHKSTQEPFPADHDECYAALRWVQEHGEALGGDTSRIAVAGDSAGGGLAAGLVQRAFDEGHPVRALGLVYPMLDHRTTEKAGAVGQFIWTAGPNRGAWSMYLGNDHLDVDLPPYASPATRSDLSGLPPTWIGVGGIDLFCDESVAFAQALDAAGVDTTLDVWAGAYHGFDQIKPKAPQSRELFDALIDHLRRHL